MIENPFGSDVAANEETGARTLRVLFDRKRGIKPADVRLPSTSTNRSERATIRSSITLDIPRITDELAFSIRDIFIIGIPRKPLSEHREEARRFHLSLCLLHSLIPPPPPPRERATFQA